MSDYHDALRQIASEETHLVNPDRTIIVFYKQHIPELKRTQMQFPEIQQTLQQIINMLAEKDAVWFEIHA